MDGVWWHVQSRQPATVDLKGRGPIELFAGPAVHLVGNCIELVLAFAGMPRPLQRLRQGLMRHDGEDKIMAQVLNCVSSHGLEAVLVAVELVIESGVFSTEHVLNTTYWNFTGRPWRPAGMRGPAVVSGGLKARKNGG